MKPGQNEQPPSNRRSRRAAAAQTGIPFTPLPNPNITTSGGITRRQAAGIAVAGTLAGGGLVAAGVALGRQPTPIAAEKPVSPQVPPSTQSAEQSAGRKAPEWIKKGAKTSIACGADTNYEVSAALPNGMVEILDPQKKAVQEIPLPNELLIQREKYKAPQKGQDVWFDSLEYLGPFQFKEIVKIETEKDFKVVDKNGIVFGGKPDRYVTVQLPVAKKGDKVFHQWYKDPIKRTGEQVWSGQLLDDGRMEPDENGGQRKVYNVLMGDGKTTQTIPASELRRTPVLGNEQGWRKLDAPNSATITPSPTPAPPRR